MSILVLIGCVVGNPDLWRRMRQTAGVMDTLHLPRSGIVQQPFPPSSLRRCDKNVIVFGSNPFKYSTNGSTPGRCIWLRSIVESKIFRTRQNAPMVSGTSAQSCLRESHRAAQKHRRIDLTDWERNPCGSRKPAPAIHTFLGKPESARWAVPLLVPVSAVISRQERPCTRRAAILEASTTTFGLPRCLPLARAFRRPALLRAGNGAEKLVHNLVHTLVNLHRSPSQLRIARAALPTGSKPA